MKKTKIKKTFIGVLLGILLGLIFGHIASQLSVQDTVLFAITLLISVIAIAFIMMDDIEIRLNKAYCKGKQEALKPAHANCRCTVIPKKD